MAEYKPKVEKKTDDEENISKDESSFLHINDERFRAKTSSDLVRRIINDGFQGAVSSFHYNPESERKVRNFTRYLSKASVNTEGQFCVRIREVLRHLSPKYREKYRSLEAAVSAWRPKRQALIENLDSYIAKLDGNSKISTVVRFVSSSADIVGSIGGIMFQNESEWANHAFKFASFCGLCGLVSTVAEVDNSKRILEDVSKQIEEDHSLLKPIVKWMEDTEEINSIVQDLFPHGIDMDIVNKVQEDLVEHENYINVFRSTLLTNVRGDLHLLENKDFLHSVQLFSRSEMAGVWWSRILYRKHPIELDVARMSLQIQFGQMQSIIFQCIPALPLEQQRLNSLPVAGRLLLNLLTSYDAFSDLRKGAKSSYSDKLRKLMDSFGSQLASVNKTIADLNPQNT